MLSNLFLIIKISSVVLLVFFLFHVKFRTCIKKKYPTVIRLSENGKGVVHIYALSISGVFRYRKYEFSVKDHECKDNMLTESLLLVVGYAFILNIVNLVLYDKFSGNVSMIIVNTLCPDVVFFGLLFRGKHLAYTALKKYLQNGNRLEDAEFLYDKEQASKMYMAGLEADGIRTSFPWISDDEIAHIEKDGDDKKLHQFIRKKKKFMIVCVVTSILSVSLGIVTLVVFRETLCLAIAFLVAILECVLQQFLGLRCCPYCGIDFGRHDPVLFCDHCRKPLTEATKHLLEFAEEDDKEDDEGMKRIRAAVKDMMDELKNI